MKTKIGIDGLSILTISKKNFKKKLDVNRIKTDSGRQVEKTKMTRE